MDPAESVTLPPAELASEQQTERQIASEIDEYLYVHEERRRILPRAVLVGFLAGVVAVAFGASLQTMDVMRLTMIEWAHQFSFGWIFPIAFGAILTAISIALVRTYAPETNGSGIP